MRLYLLEAVDRVSPSWHANGGLIIVAENFAHARRLAEAEPYVDVTDDEWSHAETYVLTDSPPNEPKVYVFPDAGCC